MRTGGKRDAGRELSEKKEQVFHMLALDFRKVFQMERYEFLKLQEIRMRVGKPMIVVYEGEEYYISEQGSFTKQIGQAMYVSEAHIKESLEYISNYSMYAFEEEIRQGYVTVAGGHRVGLAGKVIWERGSTKSMRYISFLNIRLAHEIKGCADRLLPLLYQKDMLCHTLIISPPGCGKTTLLRDIIRQVSNGNRGRAGLTVGVVDERSEIAACYQGKPENDLGCRTDVLDGCPKSQGMMMLVRSMAPRVIAVDEAGSTEDVEAMEYVMNCGVRLIATVHGTSLAEVRGKPAFIPILKEKLFERYVLLKADTVGEIEAVFDANGTEKRIGREREWKAC